MTNHLDRIPPPPTPASVLAAFAAIGLPGVHLDGQYRRNAECGWYLRAHLPPAHTAVCIAGSRRNDLHAALGWPGRLWLLPEASDPHALALVFHDPDNADDPDEKDDPHLMNTHDPHPVPEGPDPVTTPDTTSTVETDGVAPMRVPDVDRPYDVPLSWPRRILAVPTLAASLALLPVAVHAAAGGWHRTAGHATLLAVLVTLVAAVAGVRGLARAWRGPQDTEDAGPVYDCLFLAAAIGAGLTHHWTYAGMLAALWFAFGMTLGFYPERMDGRSEHAAASYATAWTAREAAAYTRRLLTDPAHDGLTAAQLIEQFTRHAHAYAAEVAGDIADRPDPDTPDGTVCASCHTPTTTTPCRTHQPFAAHHHDLTHQPEATR